MDFTDFGVATSRAELLGPEEDFTRTAQATRNVADLTHPSVSATCASLRTYTASEYRPDGSVKRLTVWASRDGRNRAELLGSAAGDTQRSGSVQTARPVLRGEESTHPTHSSFARVHHHREGLIPAAVVTGACILFALYGIGLCIWALAR